MALKQRNNPYKLSIILFLTFCVLMIPTKDSFASNPPIMGFIIEAKQMEGTLQEPELVVGDTTGEKDRAMLELVFDQINSDDLVIKKLVATPKGIITLQMTAKNDIQFKNLKLKVTNAIFQEHYVPANGNIGLKDVKLLVHSVTTDNSSLPQFNLSYHEMGQVEIEPKSKEELLYMKTVLDNLMSVKP